MGAIAAAHIGAVPRQPPNTPFEQFWSLTIYDVSTRTLIANKEQIADRSSRMDLVKNSDGGPLRGPDGSTWLREELESNRPGRAAWTRPDFDEVR